MSFIENILFNKKKMFLVLLILLVVVVVKVFCFPVYEAESVVMVDIKNRATSIESEKIDLSNYLGYIRNHEELFKSEPVLRKVVEDLDLFKDFAPRNADLSTYTNIQKEKLIRKVMDFLKNKGVTVSSIPFTNLINIKVKYKNAEKAYLITNLLVKTYMEWNVRFTHTEIDTVIDYLSLEVIKAKEQLGISEDKLRNFKVENNIIDLPEEVKTYLQMIPEEFKIQYQYAQANQLKLLDMKNALNLEKKNSIYQLMQYAQANQLKAMEVTNALNLETNKAIYQLIQTTSDKLLELQVELMRLRELYTDESPQIKYMKQNIQELQSKLNVLYLQMKDQEKINRKLIEDETEKFINKLSEVSTQSNEQDKMSKDQIENEAVRFKEFSKSYQINEKYLDRLKGLPEKQMILARLERDLKINEEAYLFLVKEQEKANLVKAKQTTQDVKVVSLARLPLKPKGRITGLVAGSFISLMFTLGLPFLWKNRRIFN